MKFIAGEPMNPATNRLFGWLYSSIGEPTCWRRPARMTATRSPSVMASVWSWVTYTVVVPRLFWIRETSVRICTRSLASRFDSGSSMRKTAGSRTIARPIATRWRWPPDSCDGLRSRCCSRSSTRAASMTFLSISAASSFRSFSAKPMLSRTLMCG